MARLPILAHVSLKVESVYCRPNAIHGKYRPIPPNEDESCNYQERDMEGSDQDKNSPIIVTRLTNAASTGGRALWYMFTLMFCHDRILAF